MKQIKFTDGCPNGCKYCYEPLVETKFYDPIIPDDNDIKILDMNFLYNPNALEILRSLPKGNYEFVCGVDYRRLTQEICNLMKEKGFNKIRWAWDYTFAQHPAQKPLEMIEDIIRWCSDEGDVVLDPYMGSGTVALACKKSNRKFIGFENDKSCQAIIEKRLNGANQTQGVLTDTRLIASCIH